MPPPMTATSKVFIFDESFSRDAIAERGRHPALRYRVAAKHQSTPERDVYNLEAQLSHRHLNLGGVALFLADEALADGAVGEDLVLGEVLFAGADQDKRFFLVQVEIFDSHMGAER